MKIEKLCEYLSDMGLLKLDNINNFLKIYSQISKNKYKSESDKVILALFSYFALISKNKQNLYDICKNIIGCYANNLILNRYKGIKYLNNIFHSKLHSRYHLFLIKLISYTNRKQKKIFNQKNNNNNLDINHRKEKLKNNTQLNFYNNNINNNNYFPNYNHSEIKKGKIITKNKNDNFDDINDIIDKLSSSDKENEYFTFSPRNNNNNKSGEFKTNNNNNNSRKIKFKL